MWATGDLIGLIVVAALFVQWSRADAREAVRTDRALDRGAGLAGQRAADDAEETDAWTAYNAHLAALARHEAGTS
jgi:hypothetical protein